MPAPTRSAIFMVQLPLAIIAECSRWKSNPQITDSKSAASAYCATGAWHGVLYWLSPFTKGNDPLRQSHVRVTTLLFCLYFQKSFHTSNNAPIYAMYTYINHCKESDMTIFLIIGLQYPWRRNWDSDPGTTLRCLRFSRPLHSTTLPLRHNNEFPVPQNRLLVLSLTP